MDKAERISKYAQTDEDRILLAKVYDKIQTGISREIPVSTSFLAPREIAVVKAFLGNEKVAFFGGHVEAERCICAYLPEYLDEDFLMDDEASPVCAVRAKFYAGDQLTHRDFLGSLMGCGIKRETVGDIFVSEGSCDFFVTREILPFVLQNLESAGRTKLHLTAISLGEVSLPQDEGREVSATVSSLRLDCILGAGFGLARGKVAAAIESGRVLLNDLPVIKADKQLSQGDKITLRGMGKLLLTEVGGKTRKDRICVKITRYG